MAYAPLGPPQSSAGSVGLEIRRRCGAPVASEGPGFSVPQPQLPRAATVSVQPECGGRGAREGVGNLAAGGEESRAHAGGQKPKLGWKP